MIEIFENMLGLGIMASFLFSALVVYIVPSIVAYFRRHKQLPAIIVLNMFGFTGILWVVALAWAFMETDK